MSSFVLHWVVLALALWFTSRVVPGVSVDSMPSLALAAAVLGFVNAFVRPLMTFFTLPLTLLTLGLFYFVVNGAAFGLAAALVPGFRLSSFLAAMAGAFVTGLAAWVVGLVVKPKGRPAAGRHQRS